ncbi:unnamed protein product [Bemisia tabaci]|uniref:Secreted protein n=1 Tax=Bemisia tabaci TaxID=7038 RepID=A0A9P0ALU4_BEMTA|nr:unnamed protein product [Bemisia tabaci]
MDVPVCCLIFFFTVAVPVGSRNGTRLFHPARGCVKGRNLMFREHPCVTYCRERWGEPTSERYQPPFASAICRFRRCLCTVNVWYWPLLTRSEKARHICFFEIVCARVFRKLESLCQNTTKRCVHETP